jgi:hypothetical protein
LWLAGRLIAFLSYAGVAALLALFSFRRWEPAGAAAATGLFLLSPTWAFWGTVVRVDTLMIFLNFFCVVLILSLLEKPKISAQTPSPWAPWIMMAGGFLNALAILNKPTALTVTAAVILTLVVRKKWAWLGWFALSSIGTAALVLSLLQWYSRGLFFLNSFGMGGDYQFELLWYFLCHSFFPEAGWLVGLTVLAFGAGRVPLFWKFLLFFSILNLFTLGHPDGAENYYLEFILYGILASGEALWSKQRKFIGREWPVGREGAVVFLLVFGFYQMTHLHEGGSVEDLSIARRAFGAGRGSSTHGRKENLASGSRLPGPGR